MRNYIRVVVGIVILLTAYSVSFFFLYDIRGKEYRIASISLKNNIEHQDLVLVGPTGKYEFLDEYPSVIPYFFPIHLAIFMKYNEGEVHQAIDFDRSKVINGKGATQ